MKPRIQFNLWLVVVFVSLTALQFGAIRKLNDDWISVRALSGLVITIVFSGFLEAELISYVVFASLRNVRPEHVRSFRRLLILLVPPLMLGLFLGFFC